MVQFSRRIKRAFTLLEIMIALGIMAIGMSAALGLFTAAAASGRRAEQLIESGHIADAVFSEVQSQLTMSFKFQEQATLSPEQAEEMGLEVDLAEDIEEDLGEEEAGEDGEETGDGGGAPEAPMDSAGASGDSAPRVVIEGVVLEGHPGYRVWAILTPLPGQSEEPLALFCEVYVQWSNRGRRRGAQYRTVLLRRLSKIDVPSMAGKIEREQRGR